MIETIPETELSSPEGLTQDDLYRWVAGEYGAALDRLAGAYEADVDKRRDLLQEVHVALWRSFASSLWWKSHIETRVDKLVLWQW
ncbi:MAG: hypothetical protein O2968_14845, partial [Acidobacteria bacterium]|nr:hypothetical protein [Acidobacteriota bacterium]